MDLRRTSDIAQTPAAALAVAHWPDGGRECPGCHALAYADDRYCACCGARLDRHCSACGRTITHPVANYCTQCGAGLGAPNPSE